MLHFLFTAQASPPPAIDPPVIVQNLPNGRDNSIESPPPVLPANPRPMDRLLEQERTPSPPRGLETPEFMQPGEVRPLTGRADNVPMFNSNSPEVVQEPGILLSTFPSEGMRVPSAHLNFPFSGRFDLFSHHVARVRRLGDPSSLMQGILVHNPGREPVLLEVLEAASYLTRPDALFIELEPIVEDPIGRVYAGPGSRISSDVLRRRRQGVWPNSIIVPPGESRMLMNLPIPVGDKPNDDRPASNARSTLMRLRSSGRVYVADMAMFAPRNPDGSERVPQLEEWQRLLVESGRAGPPDVSPTPFDVKIQQSIATSQFTYSRVAGVSQGSLWQATLTDPNSEFLKVPKPGFSISYGLSTLYRGRLSSNQIQTAPMLVRYPETAYQAHGNYGLEYNLQLPLLNATNQRQQVTIAIQTPFKEDNPIGGLVFRDPPENRVFFRGPVRLRYIDGNGVIQTRYIHLVQRRGERSQPLLLLNMPPGSQTMVQVDLIYPPDATPPQVLTVSTLRQ